MQYVIKQNDAIEDVQVTYLNRMHQTDIKDDFPIVHCARVNDICDGSVYSLGTLEPGDFWGTNWRPFLRVISSKQPSSGLQEDIKKRYFERFCNSHMWGIHHPIGRLIDHSNYHKFEVRLVDSDELRCDVQKEIDRRVNSGIPREFALRFKYYGFDPHKLGDYRYQLSYKLWEKLKRPDQATLEKIVAEGIAIPVT